MKKILVLGALALSTGLLSEQPASAWVNAKFGVGLNWSWQSGGNNFPWGLFRNGQPPGPDCTYANGGGYQRPPSTFPGVTPYGPYDFQYFGHQPQGNGNGTGGQNTTTPVNPQTPAGGANQVSWYNNNLYQTVSYSPGYYGYNYPSSSYGYNYTAGYYNPALSYYAGYYNPALSYYGYQAPSYWYGR